MNLDKEKIAKCIEIASEMATVLVMLRERPRLIDYFAISTKVLDVGCKIYEELSGGLNIYAWDYFESHHKGIESWVLLSSVFYDYIVNNLQSKKCLSKLSKDSLSQCAWLGKFDKYEVGLITKGPSGDVEGLFVKKNEEEEIKKLLNKYFWQKYPFNNITLDDEGLIQDICSQNIYETKFIRDTENLFKSFLNAGVNNSYLIIGEPGIGKSSAVRNIVDRLELKTLRVPLKTLHFKKKDVSLASLLAVVQPEVLIIDDIDRASTTAQAEFLDFIDLCKEKIKVLIGTVNNIEKVISPLKRPGRFDEHIYVPNLEFEFVEKFLGEDEKYVANQVCHWPIAYIDYYNKMVKALGNKKARENIAVLEQRLKDSRMESDPNYM